MKQYNNTEDFMKDLYKTNIMMRDTQQGTTYNRKDAVRMLKALIDIVENEDCIYFNLSTCQTIDDIEGERTTLAQISFIDFKE